MRIIFEKIGGLLQRIIDFFYPPFRKLMPLQFFRYAASGSINLAFDWGLYYIIYNYILSQDPVSFGFFTLSAHISTFIIKFPITLCSGFLLQKYVTFTSSPLRGRVQLVRYMSIVGLNVVINILGLKLLVDGLHMYATVANILISIFVTIVSFFGQKKFAFKQG